jgi:translation initiation factor 1A
LLIVRRIKKQPLLISAGTTFGKEKVAQRARTKELRLPDQGEILGRVVKHSGRELLIVKCIGERTHLCRIRGKLRRRMWVHESDLVLFAPWDFNGEKADIICRYINSNEEILHQQDIISNEF